MVYLVRMDDETSARNGRIRVTLGPNIGQLGGQPATRRIDSHEDRRAMFRMDIEDMGVVFGAC